MLLLMLAFLLFLLAAFGIGSPVQPTGRFNLIAGGLASYVLSQLL
jgi:hypothetical protein